MATLIGFGPSTIDEPDATPPKRVPRPLALAVVLLLAFVPLGGHTSPRPDLRLTQTEAQEDPEVLRELGARAIVRRVQPALYTIDTLPRDQSAFAFARDASGNTLLVTTYQNVLASARIRFDEIPDSVHVGLGGVRVDSLHQIISVRHGSVTHRARVIAAELQRDLAILRIPGERPIIPARCTDHAVRIGDRTHMFSAGTEPGATSSVRGSAPVHSFTPPDQILTGHDLRPAGEGGPLVDRFGRAIGVASRQVEPSDVLGDHDAYALSTDVIAAFELAGVANECPEGLEAPDPEPLVEGGLTPPELAEAILPAVVSMESILNNGLAWGSGFAVYTNGTSTWFATNHHVLGDGRFLSRPALTVRKGEQSYFGHIVAVNRRMDLAMVRVDTAFPTLAVACERVERGTRVASIGSPGDFLSPESQLQVADDVIDTFNEHYLPILLARGILGFPGGFVPWFRQGITSSFNEFFIETHPYGLPHWQSEIYLEDTIAFGRVTSANFRDVKHTAKMFHGNSGGPLVNMSGQVVGINYRFDRRAGRHAINAQRLFERLAAQAGIPDPCGAPPVEDGDEGGPSGEPETEPTETPTVSPPPGAEPSPTAAPTTES